MSSVEQLRAKGTLEVGGTAYEIYRLSAVEGAERSRSASRCSLENLLRTEDGANITADHVRALATGTPNAEPDTEIQFTPARVIMQDFTGVPCVVDLATMREAVADLGGDADQDQPARAGRARHRPLGAYRRLRPRRRVRAQRRDRVRAQPASATSSCAGARRRSTTSRSSRRAPASCTRSTSSTSPAPSWSRDGVAYPDTCVGTDSHTTMVNGLGVLGWGVGGIEAEAAMLGQPVSMLIPRVVGFKLARRDPGRRDRDRRRAHDHRDAAPARRRRQVRRVLRRGRRRRCRWPTAPPSAT